MAGNSRLFTFDGWVVDSVRRLAWSDRKSGSVTGKAFDLLAYLIEHRDRVVPKEELIKAVWPDTFVQDNTLTRHISTLRKTLGDRPGHRQCLVTVQNLGYRFVADVRELPLPQRAESVSSNQTTPDALANVPDVETSSAAEASVPALQTAVPFDFFRRGSVLAAIGSAALLATILAIVWVWRRADAEALPIVRQITYGPGSSMQPTWSPDGNALAYASDRAGNFDIWVQRLDGAEPTQVTASHAEEWQPSWSPDGRWLSFRSEQDGGGIYVVAPQGGAIRRVARGGFGPRWSPDGTKLLFSSAMVLRRPRPRIFVVDVNAGSPVEVEPDSATGVTSSTVAWAPDGRIAMWSSRGADWSFAVTSTNGYDWSSFTIDEAVARHARELSLEPARFTWAADGRSLVFEGTARGVGSLWRVAVDADRAVIRGPIERLTTGSGLDQDAALSADGHSIAYGSMSDRTRIWALGIGPAGRLTGAEEPVTTGASGEFDASVSADGERLVYRTMRDGREEVWERSVRDGQERRLIGDEGLRTSPRWSPDGTRIAYQLVGPSRPMVVFAVNEMREHLLTPPGGTSLVPDDWSRDGALILGPCMDAQSSTRVACVAPATVPGNAHPVASDPGRDLSSLRFSPNQRWISGVGRRSNTAAQGRTVVVMPNGGGAVIEVTDDDAYYQKPIWSGDGRTLYFVSNRDGFFNVWGRHFDPERGTLVGGMFQLTAFSSPRRMLAPNLDRLEIAVAAKHLYAPITESSGQVFVLENLR